MNPKIAKQLHYLEEAAKTLVWWSLSQIARGDHLVNDPKKGERAWIIPCTTGEWLYRRITEADARNVLELGTSIGYSTLWIAAAIAERDGVVHTIERNPKKVTIAGEAFLQAGLEPFIRQHEGEIAEVLTAFTTTHPAIEPFDFVFMDADRGHYHEYFPVIESMLTPDALIVADNAGNMNSRMQPFLDLLTHRGWSWEILNIDNGLLVSKNN